jgi:hypothetical protein
MNQYTPCSCGCGKMAQGKYSRGHRPLKSYRHVEGKRIHVLRAEKALGRSLPPKAVVHHADGSMSDDAPLVICENQAYHRLLHARMNIQRAGGNPNTDAFCGRCRKVKPRESFTGDRSQSDGLRGWCRDCSNTSQNARRAARIESHAREFEARR